MEKIIMETDVTKQTSEKEFVNNAFGIVTSKRVIYFRDKGWISGGSRQDIPLKHVTSVRQETSRSFKSGILLFIIGMGCLLWLVESPTIIAFAFTFILVALAILLLWGSPRVLVNTTGNDLNIAEGPPWTKSQATAFVEALRKQLFQE